MNYEVEVGTHIDLRTHRIQPQPEPRPALTYEPGTRFNFVQLFGDTMLAFRAPMSA